MTDKDTSCLQKCISKRIRETSLF